ncbi:ankyrin repeat domain-containing protein 36C-like [Acomys russatus]|uniref:ankyrin repeat domain-containing protein 36C-like n=1 Tax=Acomys russatus TaxID=60746 RepID=UPI0021E1E15C|nr:ankyrin repeat domain-containing protein 36C-like [Acomys russatus]
MKKIFKVKQKTPLGFCDSPQTTVSEFFFGDCPNYPKYHTSYRPVGQIHRVAAEGDAAQMEILITLGQCSVYDRDRKNRTALHFACVYGRLPVVTVLVNNNCEIDAVDKNLVTPLMKSVQCWKQKCAAVLLEHGANLNAVDSSGNCALHYAVYNGHEEMVALLLDYHADIEQKTKDGFTPLLLALREKRVEVAECLVKRGADIHVVDDLKRSTLIYAVRCGSKYIATLLLQKGIDFFYKDVFGWTALRYAIEGHCTFRRVLLDFEEKLYSNKKDNEAVEQTCSGNDSSLARPRPECRSPRPETPLPTMKEDKHNCDSQNISESVSPTYAGHSLVAADKTFESRGKETVEALVEKDLSLKSSSEVREAVADEAVERTELLSPFPELELMSVEDVSDESEDVQPLSILEHIPQTNVSHLPGAGYQMEKNNISGQMKESEEEHAQLMTPTEMKDSVFKEAWATNSEPTIEAGPELEVTSDEDYRRFDDRRDIQSLRIYEDLPISGNVSVSANPKREKTNRQATESAKEYPRLMPTHEKKHSVPDKAVVMEEARIAQLGEPDVNLTSEEEANSQDGFEKNSPLNIFQQIQTQDVEYLSMAEYQRGENMVACQEKEFSKECPQSKLTTVEEKPVSKEAWDMIPMKSFLEGTPKDCPLSKPTVEKNNSVPIEVPDIKHGKWLQKNCPKEYVHLKLPIKERLSFMSEAPATKQVKSYCSAESTEQMTSEEEQKCHDDRRKNQTVQGTFKQLQPKDPEYLSMASDESTENSLEGQEEDSPEQHLQWKPIQPLTEKDSAPDKLSAMKHVKSFLTVFKTNYITTEPAVKVSKGEQECCGGRNMQRQAIGNLFLPEDQRYENTIPDEEKDSPEEYSQLKPLDIRKTPLPCEVPAMKEVKSFGTEPNANLSSEEEQEWPSDSEEEHLKASIEKQDFVLTEDATMNQEKSSMTGVKTVQPRSEEEQTGWYGSDKRQRKQPIFERLQLRRNALVSVDPKESVRNTRAVEERGAARVQPRPQEAQIGWFGSDRKQWKAIFERFQSRCSARVFMDPEKSRENTGAAQERGAATVQPRLEKTQMGRFGSGRKQRKPVFEQFRPRWSAGMSMDPEESGENTRATERKGATTVQLKPEEEQMRWAGSGKKQRKPIFERQKWSARVSVGPEERRESTGAAKEKEESTMQLASKERTGCPGRERKPQLHILEQLQRKWSVRVCAEAKQGGAKRKATQMTYSPDKHPELKTAIEKQDSVPVGDLIIKHEISSMAGEDLQMKSKEKQQSHAYENIQSVNTFKRLHPEFGDHLSMTVGQRSKNIIREEEATSDLEVYSMDEQNRCYSSESNQSSPAVGAAAAAASVAESAMDELVLQRKYGKINNQRFLMKESEKHARLRKKTSKEKHKVTKEVRDTVGVTPSSEPISGDDSGSSLKMHDSLNSYNALVDLKKMSELLREKYKTMGNENSVLQKEISEIKEKKAKLEDETVKQVAEFWNLRSTLTKELAETRRVRCFYKTIRKHLSEKEKQSDERTTVVQLPMRLQAGDRVVSNARDALKEETEVQHVEAVKSTMKTKDHLQRVEHENCELKAKVKEQAKKIEELRGYLQNPCEKLEQNTKLTQAGAQGTAEESRENNIPPASQTGLRIQSLQSEASRQKTVQDLSTSAPNGYEQQCIEELKISNALLFERYRYNLYRKRRLGESRTQAHITVEQDTSPLNTSERRLAPESPCVASTRPHRRLFPREAVALSQNPLPSNGCMGSYLRMLEDEEKSIKELTELKQALEYKLYQQQKRNDEIEKEIIRIKKFLKMSKNVKEIGECSWHGNPKTGHF